MTDCVRIVEELFGVIVTQIVVGSVETSLHVLWDCKIAKKVWDELLPRSYGESFFSLCLDD